MIEQTEREEVVTLRMAHGKANAMDLELCSDLSAALRQLSGARAVVLTGTGSIFCAGVDLFRVTNEGAGYVEQFFPALIDTLTELFAFPAPLVAAMNGHAIAGGCLIGACGDYRLMSGGTIGVPELSVGVPFPAIAIEILRFATGTAAHRFASLGEVIPAEEAKTRGLIDEVVASDRLADRAHEVALRLASAPRDAFRITKGHLRDPFLRQARMRDAADREAFKSWSSEATHEHIRAYLKKTLKKQER